MFFERLENNSQGFCKMRSYLAHSKNPSMVLSFIQQEFTEHIFEARHPSRFCGYRRKKESVLWSTESNRGNKRQLENDTNKYKITL